MRWSIAGLPLLLSACAGTFLTEVQAGYELSPASGGGLEHGGSLTGHMGGSAAPGLAIGLSARGRAMTNGWAFPEVGPQIVGFFEQDNPIAFYVRGFGLVGLGQIEGGLGPVFSAVLNPGIVFYPAEDPLFLSLSLTAEFTAAPIDGYTGGWFGVRFGFGVGGVQD